MNIRSLLIAISLVMTFTIMHASESEDAQLKKPLPHDQQIKKNGATLIWAQTTVVPENEAGRFAGYDRKYNEVATTVMKKHDNHD
jgi:hypothetical protein